MELTVDRLSASCHVVSAARAELEVLRKDPVQGPFIGTLPERLAVLEGMLQEVLVASLVKMTPAEHDAWVARREATR